MTHQIGTNIGPEVEKEISLVKQILSGQKPKKGSDFYRGTVDTFSDSTRSTPAQLSYLNALEYSLAVFKRTAITLRKEMDISTLEQRLVAFKRGNKDRKTCVPEDTEKAKTGLEQEVSDVKFFANRYALHFAGQVGLALLGSEENTDKMATLEGHDTSLDHDSIIAYLRDEISRDIPGLVKQFKEKGAQVTDDTFKEILGYEFATWVSQFNWRTFKDLAEKHGVAVHKLRFKNYSIVGGDFKRRFDDIRIDDKLMPVSKEDCIGAEGKYKDGDPKLGSLIWNAGKVLFGYDHDKKKNIRGKPPFVVFSYGEPGCGKTFISHAYMRSLADKFREGKKPLWVATHSVTDYASHYQNQTANALNAWAEQIKSFPGAVIAYIADADMIFHSRQDPNMTAEQKQTTSVYMKMFDGTMINKKEGRVLFIMDANYIDKIDPATQSRVFDKVAKMRNFETAEEWAALAKKLVVGSYDGIIPVTDEEWGRVGQMIMDTGLSTREASSVLGQVVGDMQWPEDQWYCTDAAAEDIVKGHMQGIDYRHVLDTIDKYCSTRQDIAEQSGEKLVTDPNAGFDAWEEKRKGWCADLNKQSKDTVSYSK